MSKLLKVTLLLALAVGLFGAYRHIAAQEDEPSRSRARMTPPTFDVQVSQEPSALATNHALEKTYINHGFSGIAISPSTYTPIDTQLTVLCPGTSGTCTIQGEMVLQNQGNVTSFNPIIICLYVDGKPSEDCGPDAGETLKDEAWSNTSTTQTVSGLTHGNHTVQTYFWTQFGGQVGYYSSNYRVYKP
jgi:hypothetical protein